MEPAWLFTYVACGIIFVDALLLWWIFSAPSDAPRDESASQGRDARRRNGTRASRWFSILGRLGFATVQMGALASFYSLIAPCVGALFNEIEIAQLERDGTAVFAQLGVSHNGVRHDIRGDGWFYWWDKTPPTVGCHLNVTWTVDGMPPGQSMQELAETVGRTLGPDTNVKWGSVWISVERVVGVTESGSLHRIWTDEQEETAYYLPLWGAWSLWDCRCVPRVELTGE